MNKRRVVITGIGIVSPIGMGKENYWAGLMKCESSAAPITAFDASKYASTFACEVKDFNPDDYIDPKKSRRMDRFTQIGVAASKMAMDDSGLNVANSS